VAHFLSGTLIYVLNSFVAINFDSDL